MSHSVSLILLLTLLGADAPSKAPATASLHPAVSWTTMRTVTLGAHRFTLPAGMGIELAAGPPLVERPIHADFDDQGRLYVAESSGSNDPVEKQLQLKPHRILRLEDTDGDGKFDKRTIFADKLMFPEGMLWHDGSIYVAAPPSIWKFTDSNGDGIADNRVEWFKGETLTHCANDLHGPYLGPDGWIYWCKGAFARQTYPRPGKAPFVTRAAHIFRARPDGSGLEPVMTGGMDNPVELVFTPTGERIFTTTFFQYPRDGKRDGLIHSLYGGVYGKVHDVIDEHPRTGDPLPPMTHLGPAAPAGLCRVQFQSPRHETLHGKLLVAQFNMHKVSWHTLQEQGATFTTTDGDLLLSDNVDFHPTDVLEDADGSLLVINTGGWYKLCCPSSQLWKPDVLGGIYRLQDRQANVRSGLMHPASDREWQQMSDRAVLEKTVGPGFPSKRAFRELQRRGKSLVGFLAGVVGETREQDLCELPVRLNALWMLTRIDAPAARAAVRQALHHQEAAISQVALQSVSLWRDAAAVPDLLTFLTRRELPFHRRLAAEALGRIGAREGVPRLLGMAGEQLPRELEHAVIYALIEIADAGQTAAGLNSPQATTRRVALIALDQMPGGRLDPHHVAPLLAAKEPILRETAVWLASRHADWGAALAPVLMRQLRQQPWDAGASEQLTLQFARICRDVEVQALVAEQLSQRDMTPAAASVLLRAMQQADLKRPPEIWGAAITGALRSKHPEVVRDALATLRAWPSRSFSSAPWGAVLPEVAGRADLPGAVRLQALAAVPGGLSPVPETVFYFIRTYLAEDAAVSEKLTAADVLVKAQLTQSQLLSLAADIRRAGPFEIEALLQVFKQTDEETALVLAAALLKSRSLANVKRDTLQRLFAERSPPVASLAAAVFERQRESTRLQNDRIESLLAKMKTGDIRRGQQVFHGGKVACATCHALGYVGGRLGPDLTRIGEIRTERDLLEAIIFPSASFVRSYEPLSVILKSGKTQSGLLKKETAEELILAINATEQVRIPREEIEELHPGTVSIMPAGLDQQLTPQELIDLVTFLKSRR